MYQYNDGVLRANRTLHTVEAVECCTVQSKVTVLTFSFAPCAFIHGDQTSFACFTCIVRMLAFANNNDSSGFGEMLHTV